MNHPLIKPYDVINVAGKECVVMAVFSENSLNGVCKVVFNKTKPTTHDVDWDGEKWIFPERPDFGGYGRDDNPFVRHLRKGRE